MTKIQRREGTKYIAEAHCAETRMAVFNGRVIVVCPHCQPQVIEDGKLQPLKLC